MEALAFASSVGALAVYLGTDARDTTLAGNHVEYGQPWRSGQHPNHGLTRLVHPDSDRFITANSQMEHLPLETMKKNYTRARLTATSYTTNQRNNHLIHENYAHLPVFMRFGNNNEGPSQYSRPGKRQYGEQYMGRRALPGNKKPKLFGEGITFGKIHNLGNGPYPNTESDPRS